MRLQRQRPKNTALRRFFSGFATGFCCVILLFLLAIFNFPVVEKYLSSTKAEVLPSCADLSDDVTARPGENCLFFSLPLCKDVADPEPRVNCADLIHLPLCSQIVLSEESIAKPGKNCVGLCSQAEYNNPNPNADPALERGVDFAIFNKDCIRFCDAPEDGVVADVGVNCAVRKCHQVADDVTPEAGANCDISPCNLLTPDELNKPKFDDETKKYCEGDDLKCYEFVAAQLQFMRIRDQNPTCQIHTCKPVVASCGEDDTLNVINKGDEYVQTYERYINAGFPIDSNLACVPIMCRPVVTVQYRCTVDGNDNISGDNARDILRNGNCDSEGDGSVCAGNYCFKTIDCNKPENASADECRIANDTAQENGDFVDPFDSWFYRPKPLDKAVHVGNGIVRTMQPELCYTYSQMRHDNDWGNYVSWFIFDLGWFHDYLRMDTRSPGWCGAPHHGNRGVGYPYLCGTDGLLYNKPSDDVSYYKGYVRTVFSHDSARHVITVCTRFKNTMTLNACGKRECGITAAFVKSNSSGIRGQTCGGDVCRDFELEDISGSNCIMDEELSGSSGDGTCAKTIDTYIRTRVVKYGDKVCAFLDSKGQLAYNGMFFDGTETLDDGITCVNDPDGDGREGCDGFDTNSDQGLAHKWRTLLKVPYIKNNRPASDRVRGYLDKSGRLFPEQECPKIRLRIPPPDTYNLANAANSPKLFSPPLYIRSVTKIRGGEDAPPVNGEYFGRTDFHYPEIKVQYGATVQKMSLGIDELDGSLLERQYEASPGATSVRIMINQKEYVAEIFVRKEYSQNGQEPLFCLYRKIKDGNGNYISPYRVGCVNRNLPDINNSFERTVNPALPGRQALVYGAQDLRYNRPNMVFRLAASYGVNGIYDACQNDDVCTAPYTFENVTASDPLCVVDVENYKFCAKREECSKLYNECVVNEVNISNAQDGDSQMGNYLSLRRYCNETLIPLCNYKKGITTNEGANVYDMNPSQAPIDLKAYGWFNEMCIVSGFERKLKTVIAQITDNNALGKCFIDPTSPYLMDNNPSTTCDAGGFAPHCRCIEAPQGYITSRGEVLRTETPREAGLCVDIPLPELCPVVSYNLSPNRLDPNDPDYISQSLGKTEYNNNTGVNESHRFRTEGKPEPNPIRLAGHADFAATLLGVNNVKGQCKAYWKYKTNAQGVELKPTMSCLDNNGEAQWDYFIQNPCERYSCPAVTTLGPNEAGFYQGNYAQNETGEDKGRSEGFATWPKLTKTNDFMEYANAIACIPGFKPVNAAAIRNADGAITSYTTPTPPIRACDQLGNWREVQNACQRISCQEINPPIPQNGSDMQAWSQWFDSGGATFPSVFASRSASRIQNESISTGTCNNALGFFRTPNGNPPTRRCDHLGNWLPVRDPCVSTCDAITDDNVARDFNNGYAKWDRTEAVLSGDGAPGTFLGCVAGYIQNPYPPAFDIAGRALSPEIANDLTRSAEEPKRLCTIGVNNYGSAVNIWGVVVSGCINRCPGAELDPRIGVGKTTHPTSRGEVTLDWPDGRFGEYSYVTNWEGEESELNASHFKGNRTNGKYLMRRFCNNDGKWSQPEAMCSGNGGQIDNAKYSLANNQTSGYRNSIAVATDEEVVGTCIPGFWHHDHNQSPAPTRECYYRGFAEGARNIDETYLDKREGLLDCEPIQCAPQTYLGTRSSLQVNEYKNVGDQVTGSCLNNQRNSAGQIVYTSLFGAPPRFECQGDGTWRIVGEENCKKGCDVPETPVVHHDISGCDGDGEWFRIRSHSLQHGQWLSNTTFGCKCGKCTSWTRGEVCQDGVVSYANWPVTPWDVDGTWWRNYAYSGSPVKVKIYDPITNSFVGERLFYDRNWGALFNSNSGSDVKSQDDWRNVYSSTPHINKNNSPQYLGIGNND